MHIIETSINKTVENALSLFDILDIFIESFVMVTTA